MRAHRLALAELRRLTSGRMLRLALVAMLIIPSLYAGLYLYANKDPYANFKNVPAAIAVEDEGADLPGGDKLHAGDKVATELLKSNTFDWRKVTRTEAMEGVDHERYAFAIIIPKDFSRELTSVSTNNPKQARLEQYTNDTNGYLAHTISNTVTQEVSRSITGQVSREVTHQVLNQLGKARDGLQQAADGASKLAEGTTKLKQGTGQAHEGATKLAQGTTQIQEGTRALVRATHQARDGSKQLAEGTTKLEGGLGQLESATRTLPDSTRRLAEGASQVANGNKQLATISGNVDARRQEVAQQWVAQRNLIRQQEADTRAQLETLDQLLSRRDLSPQQRRDLESTRREVGDARNQLLAARDRFDARLSAANQRAATANQQVQRLADGSQQVAQGAGQLADASGKLTAGIQQGHQGSAQLAQGAQQLHAGLDKLSFGAEQLNFYTGQATRGAQDLSTGLKQLDEGAEQVRQGSVTLRDKLSEAVKRLPQYNDQQEEQLANVLSAPVVLEDDHPVKAANYGAGLAPFFLSLSLWIGAYVLFLLVHPLSNRALAANQPAWRVALSGWMVPALLGGGQALLVYFLVLRGLGFSVRYQALTVLFLVGVSLCYTAVLHALAASLGAVGKFLGLVMLVLQLVSSGGTFPWQTLPEPLQVVHQVIPMSYAIDGLRHLMYGGLEWFILRDVGILLLWWAVGFSVSVWAASKARTWTPSRISPDLSL